MDIIEDTKIVFIDIDGTLTNSKQEVTEKSTDIIEQIKNKGIHVVLCSGRPNNYTTKKSKEANASPITISCSGNLVYDYLKNEIIAINEINKDDLRILFDYCNEHKHDCILDGILKVYRNKYSTRKHTLAMDIYEIEEPICQLNIHTKTLEEAKLLRKFINDTEIFSTGFISESVLNNNESADVYEFDVMYKNCGKGDGIKKLLNYLSIPMEETMCFGDYINDYSMFKECDITVAMGNSTNKLKKLADFTTLTNDNDGVAVFLEENLL